MEKTAGFVMYLFHTGMSVFRGINCNVYLDINTRCLMRYYNHVSGCTTFTEVYNAPQNSLPQKGDMKHVLY